jgi:hypothetical protein
MSEACKNTYLEITPAMIEAGVERYADLNHQVASAYLVSEVFVAMCEALKHSGPHPDRVFQTTPP